MSLFCFPNSINQTRATIFQSSKLSIEYGALSSAASNGDIERLETSFLPSLNRIWYRFISDHSERQHESEAHMEPRDLYSDNVGCQSYMRYNVVFDVVSYSENAYSQTPMSYGRIVALEADGRPRVGFHETLH